MTKEELIQFLRENLSISVSTDWGGEVSVSLYLGDECISYGDGSIVTCNNPLEE